MDDTIARIVQAAAALDPAEQGWFIAAEAIKAARAADAAISAQALEAEYVAWFQREYGRRPTAVSPAVMSWGRHLLSRGQA
jgi:hypothetical protein